MSYDMRNYGPYDDDDDDDDIGYTSRELVDPEAYYDMDEHWDLDRLYDPDEYYP